MYDTATIKFETMQYSKVLKVDEIVIIETTRVCNMIFPLRMSEAVHKNLTAAEKVTSMSGVCNIILSLTVSKVDKMKLITSVCSIALPHIIIAAIITSTSVETRRYIYMIAIICDMITMKMMLGKENE